MRHSPVANVGSGFGLTKMIHSPPVDGSAGLTKMIHSPVANVGSGGLVRFIERKGLVTTKSFFFGILWFYLLLELWCGGPQNNGPGRRLGPKGF